jgi:hypothetical protein
MQIPHRWQTLFVKFIGTKTESVYELRRKINTESKILGADVASTGNLLLLSIVFNGGFVC